MRYIIGLALSCVVAGLGLFLLASRPVKPATETAGPEIADPTSAVETASVPAATPNNPKSPAPARTEAPPAQPRDTVPAGTAPAAETSATAEAQVVQSAVATLVSPQSSFEQKQGAWGRLRNSGKLDNAIKELEQRYTANPNTAEYPAALGQAYLQKAGTIQDIREQGVLGLKADQTFEAALATDENNWDARFWKTTAMSYWPPQLGKGKEVISEYLELIKQQETQAPQPHFAQTYALLGDQYVKDGQLEQASDIWQRGLALFPSDPSLQKKANSGTEAKAGAAR